MVAKIGSLQELAPMGEGAAMAHTPHLLLVTFPGQGHVNPMLRLAKRLTAKGLTVTFSSTSDIGSKLAESSGASLGGDGLPIGRGRLRFEFLDDEFTGSNLDDLMRHLETTGPPAFAELIRRQAEAGRPVTCVVGNPFIPWALDVATDAGIPTAILWVQSCAVFSLYYHYLHALAEFPSEDDREARFSLPGLPAMTVGEVPSFLLPSNPFKSLTTAILAQFKGIDRASWVFVNSFEELERDVVTALGGIAPRPPPLIPVGPLIELEEEEGSQDKKPSVRGDLITAADECVEWLDSQTERSVIYASVGSIVVLNAEEMSEMAHGLASTGRPFLWVVRSESRALLPEGFLDTVGDRGMVVPWSPQDNVLAHAATACFLTHCGWNSTLESLAAGVPVIAYPQWGDQVTDAKFLVEVFKTGVRLRGPVRREGVKDAVEAVVAGPEAASMRANAEVWKAASREAAAPGGSSDRHIQAFVDEVLKRACGGEHTGGHVAKVAKE